MKFGFIPTEGGHLYPESLLEVIYGEELGFDSVFLEEHHSVRNHYWPSPLIGLAGYASRTSHLLLGTDIVVMPFYHPVRLAEDAAMLDVISAGRFILGIAIGYRPVEFALYDVPMEKRGARFAEGLQLMRRLWTEDHIFFEGNFFHTQNACIEPKPTSKTGVPLWLGGWGELSLKRAAEFGDAWVTGPTAGLQKLLEAQAAYRRALRVLGKDPDHFPNPMTREVIIADTSAKAYELAEQHLLVNYRDEYGGGWEHPLIGNEDSAPLDRLEELGRDRFIIGNPEECIARIKNFQDYFGVDHLICRLYFPGMPHEHIMRELELLSKEVMPAFRK
jgi:alkanesulfonate monooxygenase SsuD/methylene tetrahydromethanopterin reductase-like flavin-dependent oxidoreductase (luciferase family)